MNEEQKKQHIERIMNEFDFDKVHQVMTNLNWAWFNADGVPDKARLKKTARKHLEDVANGTYIVSSSGGLRAERKTGEHGDEYLRLAFQVEWINTDY